MSVIGDGSGLLVWGHHRDLELMSSQHNLDFDIRLLMSQRTAIAPSSIVRNPLLRSNTPCSRNSISQADRSGIYWLDITQVDTSRIGRWWYGITRRCSRSRRGWCWVWIWIALKRLLGRRLALSRCSTRSLCRCRGVSTYKYQLYRLRNTQCGQDL